MGIDAIGLATLAHGFRVVAGIVGVQHIDQEAQLVGQCGQQFMIAAGGFHADAAACGQALESGQQGDTAVGDCARSEALLGAGEDDFVFGDIGSDIEREGLHLHDVGLRG